MDALAALLSVISAFLLGVLEALRRRRRQQAQERQADRRAERRDLDFHLKLFKHYGDLINELRTEIGRRDQGHDAERRHCQERIDALEQEIAMLKATS